jgi:hypothetical protein
MFLKELVLRLNRTLWGQFLREICPLKKMTPKYNAASGIIAGELLTAPKKGFIFLGGISPSKLDLLPRIETEYKLFPKHVLSYSVKVSKGCFV